jgi:uncharacterized membrane protein YhiD involved in acid resistance
MNNLQKDLIDQGLAFVYQPQDILFNLALAFFIGLVISILYKITHKGLSYSQSFMLTIVFVTFVVSMVMMTIGNNLARAFALVGALSIIRFRTVVKDTKDTAFIFMALAGGMASGTSSYFLALAGTAFFSVIAFVLHLTNYGSFYKSEFILRFRSVNSDQEKNYSSIINSGTASYNLLHVEPSGDGLTTLLTFDIVLKKGSTPESFSSDIAAVDGVSEVTLVASKSDVDY